MMETYFSIAKLVKIQKKSYCIMCCQERYAGRAFDEHAMLFHVFHNLGHDGLAGRLELFVTVKLCLFNFLMSGMSAGRMYFSIFDACVYGGVTGICLYNQVNQL
jgi:hypothetical protein